MTTKSNGLKTMVVKTVANKSKFKVYIIQNIDRQIDLEDIASAEGLSFEELIKEMEAIVFSGTKLEHRLLY